MATGDLTVFDEAKAKMLDGDWASTDNFNCAVIDNGTAPTASTATPVIGDFTQVGSAGSYTNDGEALGDIATMVTEAAGTMTWDSSSNPTWAQNASNDTDAFFGLVFNVTDAGKDALCFIELGGPVDMSTGSLTITWNGSGLFTIA